MYIYNIYIYIYIYINIYIYIIIHDYNYIYNCTWGAFISFVPRYKMCTVCTDSITQYFNLPQMRYGWTQCLTCGEQS